MKLSDFLLGDAKPHPSSRVAKALAEGGVSRSVEFDRIEALPRREFDEFAYPDATSLYVHSPLMCQKGGCAYCRNGTPGIRPIQNAILVEAAGAQGGFFNVGVGKGKTLATLLLPNAMGSWKAVLAIPPSLAQQLMYRDVPLLSRHFKLPTMRNGDWLHHGEAEELIIVPYSQLSTESDILETLKPDLIIADEAHYLRHKDSARTRRFTRYLDAHPDTRLVVLSGTLANRSIFDFSHLLQYSLKASAPIPSGYRELASWADAIDNEGDPRATKPGALFLLAKDAESARDAFRRRLFETPGAISTTDSAYQGGISIVNLAWRPSAKIATALEHLRSLWEWDGVEYSHAMHVAQIARALAQGHFNRWVWPGGSIDHEWLEARNAWARLIRARLARTNTPGLDSPALLEAAAERGEWPSYEWDAWTAQRSKPEPLIQSIVFDTSLVEVVRRVRDGAIPAQDDNLIVWVDSPAVGNMLSRLLSWPYFGEGDDERLLKADPKLNRYIICSIKAHGTGKNLQDWNHNLVLYPPANGSTWEQLIGRTARPGQSADRVYFYTLRYTPEAEEAFTQAMEDAEFIEKTTGQPQKLLFADREPSLII